jgi:hypothetical protein
MNGTCWRRLDGGWSSFAKQETQSPSRWVQRTLVDTGQEPFRIVLYLASQDIFAVMRERGILPQEASGPS